MKEKNDHKSDHCIEEVQALNMEVLDESEEDIPGEIPIEVPEAHSIRALLLIEQYASLRSEIEKRIDIRQQILALTLLVAGTFLTVGVQPGIPGVVLLFYPIIALFLGVLWEHNDLRVGQITMYIHTEVEKHLGKLGPGWESFRAKTFSTRYKRRKSHEKEQGHFLTPRLGLIIFATRGMFFTTQLMAIVVAAIRYTSQFLQQGLAIDMIEPKQALINIAIGLLFLLDIIILIYTLFIVQHKRI
jgi:hypothetical protein